MKIATLCFTTDQGLSILAKSFYNHGIVTHPIIVAHGRRPEHPEWYPDAPYITNFKDRTQSLLIRNILREMDAVLFFETPFDWTLLPWCRENKIRSYLSVMYECMPRELPYQPDRFICPSLLDLQYFPERSVFLPVPAEAPGGYRKRKRAEVFVHNAGHGGLKGRNGTAEVLEAWQHVTTPARLIVRAQDNPLPAGVWGDFVRRGESRISFRLGQTIPRTELYREGEVFLFPEKFNGLSLPLQEAHASGMLVMAGNRFPVNTWLPIDPLIPVSGHRTNQVAGRCVEFQEALYDPRQIAATIDHWYGREIGEFSERGRAWAEANSWERLKPSYLEELSR